MKYDTIVLCTILVLIAFLLVLLCRKHRTLLKILFSMYVLLVLWFTLFSRVPMENYTYTVQAFRALRNVVRLDGGLFAFMRALLLEGWSNGMQRLHVESLVHFEGVLLNILLFMPFGFLLPLLWKNINSWWKIAIFAFVFSAMIEAAQGIWQLGMVEPDDLLNNTLGALLGYGMLYVVKQSPMHKPN